MWKVVYLALPVPVNDRLIDHCPIDRVCPFARPCCDRVAPLKREAEVVMENAPKGPSSIKRSCWHRFGPPWWTM